MTQVECYPGSFCVGNKCFILTAFATRRVAECVKWFQSWPLKSDIDGFVSWVQQLEHRNIWQKHRVGRSAVELQPVARSLPRLDCADGTAQAAQRPSAANPCNKNTLWMFQNLKNAPRSRHVPPAAAVAKSARRTRPQSATYKARGPWE